MCPECLGPLSGYPLFLVAASAVGCASTMWQARQERLPLGRLALLLAATALAAIVGAKLYAIAERGGGFHGIAWELGSGFRYAGGIAAAFLVMALGVGRLVPGFSLVRLLDMSALSIPFALALNRVGCLIEGCCHGLPSALPWAIRYPADSSAWKVHLGAGLIDAGAPSSAAVHPLPVYFGLSSLALALFLLSFRSRQRYPGRMLFLFLLLDGATKLVLELLRFDYAPNLQWMALAQASIGGAMLGAKARWGRRALEGMA